MIIEQLVNDYLYTFLDCEAGILGEIQKEAIENKIPIISKDTVAFLKTIVSIKRPLSILEIGTAVGFSASLMATYTDDHTKILTIEINEDMFNKATDNILRLDFDHKIKVIHGDGLEVIKDLDSKFDLIFLDASKGQYINILDDVLRLLSDDGLIIADNVLQKGTVAQDINLIERRNRTIHKRLRSFLETVTSLDTFNTTIVPIGDGVLLAQLKDR